MGNKGRLYVSDLERIYGVDFSSLKKDYKGKGTDGITDKQKQKLHDMNVNTTGIKYKGQACKVIQYLEKRKKQGYQPVSKLVNNKPNLFHGVVYRVKVVSKDWSKMSRQVFVSESHAEYHSAKVKPEYDVKIVAFHPRHVYQVGNLYFLTKEDAEPVAQKLNEKMICYIG